jgi:hypothetical protein
MTGSPKHVLDKIMLTGVNTVALSEEVCSPWGEINGLQFSVVLFCGSNKLLRDSKSKIK